MSTLVVAARAAKKRADRRVQILRAAIDVFAERGYHGASIDDIIARADIARGTFYLYFASKAAVFGSILDEALDGLTRSIRPVELDDPAAPPPQLQLRENLARVLGYLTEDRARAAVLLARNVVHEAEAAERLDAFYARVRELLMRALGHGIAMGLVRPCDVAVTAAGLLGMARGMLELVVLGTETRQPAAAEANAVIDAILDTGLRGIVKIY